MHPSLSEVLGCRRDPPDATFGHIGRNGCYAINALSAIAKGVNQGVMMPRS